MYNVSEYMPPHTPHGPCLRCKMREEHKKREELAAAKAREVECETQIRKREELVRAEMTRPRMPVVSLQEQFFTAARKKISCWGGHAIRIAKSCTKLRGVAFD